MIIASALAAMLAAACTRAPSSVATPGVGTTGTRSPAPASPSAQPGAPVPDSRTPRPAPDSAPPGPPPVHQVGPSTASGPSGTRSADSTQLAVLEREARALAKTTGCKSDEECRNAPVGIKACGGPRYYLKYCAASTDSVALFRKLAQLDTAERAYNAKYHVMSNCMMMLPTRPHIVAGACH